MVWLVGSLGLSLNVSNSFLRFSKSDFSFSSFRFFLQTRSMDKSKEQMFRYDRRFCSKILAFVVPEGRVVSHPVNGRAGLPKK